MRELLLLLCQYPYDEKNRESLLKLIGEVKDWHKTVEIINAHGIIALAAYILKRLGLRVKSQKMQWLSLRMAIFKV